MSRLSTRHPEDAMLLQYLDGELDRGQTRQVRKHLAACWECRAELEELQKTANECVRYRKQVILPGAPPPPQAWGELDFAAVDAELASESSWARLGRWLSPRRAPFRWVATGALAAALVVTAVRQLRETPAVEAAALLHKAAQMEAARPRTAKRLRVLSSRGPILRQAKVESREEAEFARLFSAARYDWSNPLSASTYAKWHDALLRKVDEVATADPAVYSLRTTTDDSELIHATLTLRKSDLEPVQARFEFRDHQWVEMTELADQPEDRTSAVAGATGGASRQPGAPPNLSSTPSPALETAGANEELQVVAAMHRIGADLGEPIEITREAGGIMVTGAGIPVERQQQIHSQLDRLPHVTVRFTIPSSPASLPVQGETATTRDAAVPADKSTHAARIEQRLGGRPQFERFSGQLLDWTDAAMSRAYALRRLAQQFPPAAEASMTKEDRRTLRSIASEYMNALQGDVQKIRRTLEPVVGQPSGTVARTAGDTASWQPQSEVVLASARRVETLLATVLGVTSGNPPGDAPAQLLIAMGQLSGDIERCQSLLSTE
jgi:hypothetical protein